MLSEVSKPLGYPSSLPCAPRIAAKPVGTEPFCDQLLRKLLRGVTLRDESRAVLLKDRKLRR